MDGFGRPFFCYNPKMEFTSTTFVVHKGKVLLHRHKIFNRWMPVGGHVEPNELPEKAALREVKEEAGLTVSLYNPDSKNGIKTDKNVKVLPAPVHILLVKYPKRQLFDFIYYAKAKNSKFLPAKNESSEMRWFGAKELKKLNTPKDIKYLAQEAIKLLS